VGQWCGRGDDPQCGEVECEVSQYSDIVQISITSNRRTTSATRAPICINSDPLHPLT
jgi:hypothetical protein